MIPPAITTALVSLEAQVDAAQPLENADQATIIALQLNAAALVKAIQDTLTVPSSVLDTWVPPSDPVSIVIGVLNDLEAAQDQTTLSLMRGVVGRATSNLEQS